MKNVNNMKDAALHWSLCALFDGDTFSVEEETDEDKEEIIDILDSTLPRKWIVAEDYAIQKMKNGTWKWVCRYTDEHFFLSHSSTLCVLLSLAVPLYQKNYKPKSLKYDKPSTWEDRVNRAIVNDQEYTDIYSYSEPQPMFDRYLQDRRILPNRWEIW